MKKRAPCFVCAVVLATAAAVATLPAQKSHDALAVARRKAAFENQHVLLWLRSRNAAANTQLEAALSNYRQLGKLLKYEYQLAVQPADSLAGEHLRAKLELPESVTPPTLIALDTTDKVLGYLMDAKGAAAFLEKHKAEPVDARKVLATGIALAKKTKRQAFVYLSAPW